MVLIALAHASNGTTVRVPYEELVLQAWRDFPQAFSLRNHPEHPDASDIHKRIYQTLRPAGLVAVLGNKVFRLTEKGISQADALINSKVASQTHANEPLRLARDEQAYLERALSSRAFETWKAGESEKLIDYDARIFFQFSTGTPVSERQVRVAFAIGAITKARQIGVDQADSLEALAEFLVDRFGSLLGG
jgi:hypothetical protein